MSHLITILCTNCGLKKETSISSEGLGHMVCNECRATAAKEKKDIFLKGLKKLSMEERVSRIEEWMYDHHLVL